MIFDVTATITPEAQPVLHAMLGRSGSGAFVVTDGDAEGQRLTLTISYTVKGGHRSDVQRALNRALGDVRPIRDVQIVEHSRETIAENG